MSTIQYPVTITRTASGCNATFPDLPGCVATGADFGEAASRSLAALALHLEDIAARVDTLPEPSALHGEELPLNSDDVLHLWMPVDIPSRFERVSTVMSHDLLRAIDAVAPDRSSWLAAAAREKLNAGVGSKLVD